jgi:hypothetical protein
LNNLTGEFQKGNRAIVAILSKMKIKTGDVFLLWRIKHLAEQGKLEINGDTTKSWKEFEVRLKTIDIRRSSCKYCGAMKKLIRI